MTFRTASAMAIVFLCAVSPALAQRVPFERTFDVAPGAHLSVDTGRGKIEVAPGPPGRIVVSGEATIRVGFDAPADALEIARGVAAQPPVSQEGTTVRLQTPADGRARRAVTVSYRVVVPPDTVVVTTSESGETTVRGVAGEVTVRTQSGAISLADLGSAASVTSGSGAIEVAGIAGALTIESGSSAITARGVGGPLRVRTKSGQVEAELTGPGEVDVETGSSSIRLVGVRGRLDARSRSGRLTLQGTPGAPWRVTSGSGSVAMTLAPDARVAIHASSRSAVRLDGLTLDGELTKRKAAGTIAGGGPEVRIESGSGSVRITSGAL